MLDFINPGSQRRRLSVGSDAQQAQRMAIKFMDWLMEGKDPEREMEHAKQAEKARGITLKDFFPVFMVRHGSRQSAKMQLFYHERFSQINRCSELINCPVSEISRHLMTDYMQLRIKQDKFSPATVNREAAFIKGMISRAVEWDILENNPLQRLRLFKETGKRDISISPEQAKALSDELPEALADIVEFASYTGFRRENILSLRIEQIRFHDLTLTGEVDLVVKGGKRETFPLGKKAVEILRRAIDGRKKEYVFLSPKTGTRWVSIHKIFDRAVRKLDLTAKDGSKLRFHDLRHVFATWLREAGVSLDDIRPLMGHANRAMTDRYATINLRAAGENLDLLPAITTAKAPAAESTEALEGAFGTNRHKLQCERLSSVPKKLVSP